MRWWGGKLQGGGCSCVGESAEIAREHKMKGTKLETMTAGERGAPAWHYFPLNSAFIRMRKEHACVLILPFHFEIVFSSI